jgi:hypothetical protein
LSAIVSCFHIPPVLPCAILLFSQTTFNSFEV